MDQTWVVNNRSIGLERPHDCVALVLQGGGALGAYQAGVYAELLNKRHQLDWIAGVSIGAINAALIAGNPPERRIERLSEFWHLVSSGMGPLTDVLFATQMMSTAVGMGRYCSAFNRISALSAAILGIPGFFQPPVVSARLRPGTSATLSIYDPAPLQATLERLVDFDLINSKTVRLSMGAVNVKSGNSEYFDNSERVIGPEHVMASCASPPTFPPMTIDGEAYWDGGIVANTPLQYVLDRRAGKSLLVFQVDLFNARGEIPVNLAEVLQRQKGILYSSRTRYNSTMAAEVANTRKAIRDLIGKLPKPLKDDANVTQLLEAMRVDPTDIVQLIYRQASCELESKDYEFSRASVLEHWQAGQSDACDTIMHPEWLKSSGVDDGVTQYDLTQHTRPL